MSQHGNEATEKLIYTISHDLQAPLRSLTSFAHLLRSECEAEMSDDAKQYLSFIDQGARRMQSRVTALVELSRAQRVEVGSEAVDLREILQRAATPLGEKLKEIGATLQCTALPTVTGNADALTKCMVHLLDNALQYRDPERPLKIGVRQLKDSGDGFHHIEVSDNGLGIPEESLELAFEVYSRLQSDEAQYPGAGMGLAICQEIFNRHGGSIHARCGAEHGTVVHFTLPLRA